MVRRRLLPLILLAGIVLALLPAAFAAASTCSKFQVEQGLCSDGSIHDGTVVIHAHGGKPGSGAPPETPLPLPDRDGNCGPNVVPSACDTFGATPPVTMDDLKAFRPTPGTDHMQPNGWMVVGLDTNFYSVVGTELQHGKVLGQVADVEFIPVAWNWTYGDGNQATRYTPGATWAAQRVHEFDPTPTSHIYTKKGTYYIDLDIRFAAEYRYAGGDWAPVVGTIDVPANRLKASAGDAKTVLVNHDCRANPGGPGC